MSAQKILVVDDKQIMRDSVAATLQRAGYTVVTAADGQAAIQQASKHRPSAVVTDLKMPEMDGLALLGELRRIDPSLPVVLMTAYGTVADAVAAMQDGAFDFIQKPFEGDQLVMVVRRAVEHRQLVSENEALRSDNASRADVAPSLVGKSPEMRRLAQQIHQVANSNGTVLICGESGTGKEVVARTVHAHSPRRDRVMLCVNCAALSTSLLESELFGHEKGAFTGADQLRKGRFELADGGTILLDEISEISPTLQAKLLRVLQEGQFERVGSSTTLTVDVRVLATTNRDLRFAVASGHFRQDLYYRLNVLPIELPSLRLREADIPLLAEHFLSQVALREGREPKKLDAAALKLLRAYPWPGNVRELQNICERASVLTRGGLIKADLIEPWLTTPGPSAPLASPLPAQTEHAANHETPPLVVTPGRVTAPPSIGPVRSLEEVEREQIVQALGYFGGNRQKTAKALGIGVRTLGLKLKKWKEQRLIAQTA
ncbi:sigma-54-dependent transcriptional regulator [Mucisphaera sp.]|uniref:sigma-54-dependent transcriptional regulator n=1 Tax=Mucisphaera sp. TaxID=2913024 RepID=UPI003D0E9FCB